MSSHFLATSRSQRFLRTDEGWIVRTREGRNLGPFQDRDAADRALAHHIRVANYTASAMMPEGYEIHDVTRCRIAGCADCEEVRVALGAIVRPDLPTD
ncbi:MAG: DUF6316 family protein [Marinobacter sp.]|uniref:DUF6316 family protein n=1 Tax=Marinobacter sp. TaxID=50741 RepID=UPI00299D93E4|nr:DUF6316 family protein [Marinobacter sp.]MDX1636233.1 DUF6316 family protein [Marinobacter sp.]